MEAIEKFEVTEEFIKTRPLSYSSLKQFRKSPQHYVKYITEPRVVTDAMIEGSLLDCVITEPEEFKQRYFIFPKVDGRTKEGKEIKAKALEEAKGRILITDEMYKSAMFAKQALFDDNEARQIMEAGTKMQKKLFWTDNKTGLPVNGRTDMEAKLWGELFCVDLKKTADADPNTWVRKDFINQDLILQAGTYREGYKRIRFQFPHFIFLCVEMTAPYGVSVNYMSGNSLKIAEEEFHGTMAAFRKCLDEGRFNESYRFRKGETMPYFTIEVPAYYKRVFMGFSDDDK